jgi:hypothetical protein
LGIGGSGFDGRVVCRDRVFEVVGVNPGDNTAVVVVHGVVPAVAAGREFGVIVVVGLAGNDLLAGFMGELVERKF